MRARTAEQVSSLNQVKMVVMRLLMALPLLWAVACASDVPPPRQISRPAADELMAIVLQHLQVELPAGQVCAGPESTTVGDFLATTLGFLALELDEHGWSDFACEEVEVDDDLREIYSDTSIFPDSVRRSLAGMTGTPRLYLCTLKWGYRSGENVWSRGLQFLIDQRSHELVGGSFRCLITP